MIPLVVDLETEWRGGQSQALLLLKGLYERGHPAELVVARGSVLGHRARKEGIYVHSVSRRMLRLRAAAGIRELLSDTRIELVHVNEPHALTAAWLAGAQKKVPLLVSRRVAYPVRPGLFARRRYLAAHRILAISRFVKDSLLGSGILPELIKLVYEGVEVAPPVTPEMRSQARQRWRVRDQETLLGCVGYLLPEKGQEFLIRALPAVRTRFPNVRLLLAGDGPCRSQLESLCREQGLEETVIFAGFVKDVWQVYAALDVFVFPSLAEPLGTSLLAAMAWGLPVLAVASGGVPEYVGHEETGLLVPHPAPDLFAAGLIRLQSEPELAKRLGASAREHIQQEFSAPHMVENTLKVYEEALGNS
ncbi:MAG TPA: glycosyltransferase family 4 protein [Candidatus Limnocylindrales bacterium]|nr:glycosyltransferase family 4 protein [Candidatus Limnocylindrales bacterium]